MRYRRFAKLKLCEIGEALQVEEVYKLSYVNEIDEIKNFQVHYYNDYIHQDPAPS